MATSDNTIQNIFNMLRDGDTYIHRNGNRENVVLLLGNTGSGKSTLTLHITGHDDKLTSRETTRDSGNYVIDDDSKKVSRGSTITSHTIFPELMIDSDTDTAFYDCPGFSDTRSAAHDIAIAYLTKQILDSSPNVKFIFVVSHPSVKEGVNRQDFMQMVKHAVTMIRDVSKFKNSIALIVTKVENRTVKRKRVYEMVSDKVMTEDIAKFLNEVKGEINKRIASTDDERRFYSNAVKLIDIFLTNNGSVYSRIGLFRQPDEAGPLSGIELLQEGKIKLKEIVKNIQFVAHVQEDFGYTISSDSRVHIQKLAEKVKEKVDLDVSLIGDSMQEHYSAEERRANDIHQMVDKFREAHHFVSSLTRTYSANDARAGNFIELLRKYVDDQSIDVLPDHFSSVESSARQLQFLQYIDAPHTSSAIVWSRGMTRTLNYLDHSRIWYNFLTKFSKALSAYDVQREVSLHATKASLLITQLKQNSRVGNHSIGGLKQFVESVVGQGSLSDVFDGVEHVQVDEAKLKLLSNLLHFSLLDKNEYTCDAGDHKLRVIGNFVKLSEVNDANDNCTQVKFIEIFAFEKIFVDVDFVKIGQHLQLSIIAPIWEIIGSRRIVLDGAPGKAHKTSKASNIGAHGKPGLPGGSAGNFLGIGDTFIRGEQLNITANGGVGGPGQDGGDGKAGKDGQDAVYQEVIGWKRLFVNFHTCDDMFDAMFPGFNREVNYIDTTLLSYKIKVKIFGKEGSNGTNGGNGGAGGNGGYGGRLSLIALAESVNGIFLSNRGNVSGSLGLGGKGGKGGKNGNIQLSHVVEHIGLFLVAACKALQFYPVSNGYKPSGSDGTNGAAIDGRKEPEPAIMPVTPANAVIDFKKYARENSRVSVTSSLSDFSRKLEDHAAVSDLYDTVALVNELKVLTVQFHSLQSKISFLPLYELLLRRISRHADKLRTSIPDKSYGEHKKALSYLYAATLSKISRMANASEDQVIDAGTILESVALDIKKLEQHEEAVSVVRHLDDYRDLMDAKIREARTLVDVQITQRLDHIAQDLDDKINLLIEETLTMERDSEIKVEELNKKKLDLENALVWQKLLGVIKVASLALNFIDPSGTASALVNEGINVVESLAFDNSDSDVTVSPFVIPEAAQNWQNGVAPQLKRDHQLLSEQLQNVQRQFDDISKQNNSADLKDIEKKLDQETNKLKENLATGDYTNVNFLGRALANQKNITQSVEKAMKILKSVNSTQTLKLSSGLGKALKLVGTPFAVFSKIKDSEKKISKVASAIDEENEKISKLKQYEYNIYEKLIPLCENIKNSPDRLTSQLEGTSAAGLRTKEWLMRDTLESVKVLVRKMTAGFKVQEDMTNLINSLEEGMTTMIDVYKVIEDYHGKRELAAYVANVNSRASLDVPLRDETLKAAVDVLKRSIQTDVVLQKYDTAMHIFKQYVFPFAHHHLEKFDLPLALQLNNTQGLVAQAVRNVNDIASGLAKSPGVITKTNKITHVKVIFDSRNENTRPFYVWKYDENKHTLRKLLDGEEVMVKSDIATGFDENAVKFNEIGLRFKLPNEKSQRDFDQHASSFEVSMTHMGNSYYRCENQFYVITSKEVPITYRSNRNGRQALSNTNEVYGKIKGNQPLLSPFTMWKIKLKKIRGTSGSLSKFKGYAMDLELTGRGSYVVRGIDVCDNTIMQRYYKLYAVEDSKPINAEKDLKSKRKRREASRYMPESIATSGASNNFQSSIVHSAVHWIRHAWVALSDSSTAKSFTGWFPGGNEEKIADRVLKAADKNVMANTILKSDNSQSTSMLIQSADDASHGYDQVQNVSFYQNENLLLLYYACRYKNSSRYKAKVQYTTLDESLLHSQYLAYSAYQNF